MNKRIVILLIILFSATAIDAQWYNKYCGVTELNNCTSEELKCLESKTKEMIVVGSIAVGVGATLFIGGYLTAENRSVEDQLADRTIKVISGIVIASLGVIAGYTGIYFTVAGLLRKSELRQIPNYEILKSGSLNISPAIRFNQINNNPYLGMTLSINI